MKLTGSYTVPIERERAYQLMQDPAVLARAMPGCDHLALIAPDEYEMRMKMVVSSIGFMKGEGLLTFTPLYTSTDIHYEGDVHVGGMIAGVGQRLLDTTSRFLIKKFFEKLTAEATAQMPQAAD